MSHMTLTGRQSRSVAAAVDSTHAYHYGHANSGRRPRIHDSGHTYPATGLGAIGRTICAWRLRRAATRPAINAVRVIAEVNRFEAAFVVGAGVVPCAEALSGPSLAAAAPLDFDTLELLEQHEHCGNYQVFRIRPDALSRFELATYCGPWAPLAARIDAALARIESAVAVSERALFAGTPGANLLGRASPDSVPLDDVARARVAAIRARRVALGILQREIGAEAGIVHHRLTHLEQGRNVRLCADTLDRLEAALDRLVAAGVGGPNRVRLYVYGPKHGPGATKSGKRQIAARYYGGCSMQTPAP